MSIHEEKSQNSLYMLLGVFFTGIALVSLVSLVVIRTKAAGGANTNTNQTANIDNVPPTISTGPVLNTDPSGGFVTVQTTYSTEGLTATKYINLRVQDSNGISDLTGVFIAVYNTATYADPATTEDLCIADTGSTCYRVTVLPNAFLGCTGDAGFENLPANTCLVSAEIPVQYFAVAGAWKAAAYATDHSDVSGVAVGASTSIATLNSINAGSSIDYGTTSVGSTVSDKTLRMENWGNQIDAVRVKSNPLTCANGTSIPPNLIAWGSTQLSSDPGTYTDFDDYALAVRTSATPTIGEDVRNQSVVLGPVNNVSGACQGNMFVSSYQP